MPSIATEVLNSDVAEADRTASVQQPELGNIERHGLVTKRGEAAAPDQRAGKYLTFILGREEFAIRVLKVREIMGIQRNGGAADTGVCQGSDQPPGQNHTGGGPALEVLHA